ncbi:MAG: NAD-dependent protein deacylase [Turicibacter sp.]|nr:NAD-dependent protein deacylase [Turicibacter sp.]
MDTAAELARLIKLGQKIVFMTGAGVSTASGIPDYRSMECIYTKTGLKNPEYLLSRRAMKDDTDDFYKFIRQLYRADATPNIIHQKMAKLSKDRDVTVITQNLDGLHKIGGLHVVEFHGTLLTCHCEKCYRPVPQEAFLESWRHEGCGGIVRPDVVLYDEMIPPKAFDEAEQALQAADTVVIVGTTFQVHPFASLIYAAAVGAKILVINKEPIPFRGAFAEYIGDAAHVFELL